MIVEQRVRHCRSHGRLQKLVCLVGKALHDMQQAADMLCYSQACDVGMQACHRAQRLMYMREQFPKQLVRQRMTHIAGCTWYQQTRCDAGNVVINSSFGQQEYGKPGHAVRESTSGMGQSERCWSPLLEGAAGVVASSSNWVLTVFAWGAGLADMVDEPFREPL